MIAGVEVSDKALVGAPNLLDAYVTEKIAAGYRFVPVTATHAAAVQHLPFHHRDPFDRLLVAQARTDDYRFVTRDRIFRKYGVDVVW